MFGTTFYVTHEFGYGPLMLEALESDVVRCQCESTFYDQWKRCTICNDCGTIKHEY